MDVLRAFAEGFGRRMTRGGRPASGSEAFVDRPAKGAAETPPADQVIKEPPMEIIGRVLSVSEFVSYVESLDVPQPGPERLFLHHTWKPTRQSWKGLDTILAMKAYYETQLWQDSAGAWHEGWTAGPHLFVADDGIWLFSDLRYDGVGVYGHNYRTRHLEMVGNYDSELPTGPTLENTVAALGAMCACWGLSPDQLAFHRDFSTKSCPGWAVRKEWIIPQVQAWVQAYGAGRQRELGELRRALKQLLAGQLLEGNP